MQLAVLERNMCMHVCIYIYIYFFIFFPSQYYFLGQCFSATAAVPAKNYMLFC